ncbi:MAG TPA: hypothetical protein VFR66_05290 [Burkholderiales bacterium]|nr:hypothetical protein [Burkholderiales bacterium]
MSDGALNYATRSVVVLVVAAFLASVAVLSCTALSLAFDEPVAVTSIAYVNPTMADMLEASHLRGGFEATPCFYKPSVWLPAETHADGRAPIDAKIISAAL